MKWRKIAGCTLGVILASVPVQGAEEEIPAEKAGEEIVLEKGEKWECPWKGEVEIENPRILKKDAQGELEALLAGETEITVRYRIKVEEKNSQNQDKEKSEELNESGERQGETEGAGEASGEVPQQGKKEDGDAEQKKDSEEGSKMEREYGGASGLEMRKVMLPDSLQDDICPELQLIYPSSLSSNQGPVAPRIAVVDEHLDMEGVKVSLRGKQQGLLTPLFTPVQESGRMVLNFSPLGEDDEYTLQIWCRDTFGNSTEQTWIFTVNQNGTVFRLQKEKGKAVYKRAFSPRILWENPDEVQVVSCTVNGKEARYSLGDGELYVDEKELKQGKNRIALTIRDGSGHLTEMEPWEFSLEDPLPESTREEKIIEKNMKKETKHQQLGMPLGELLMVLGGSLILAGKKHLAGQ